MIATPFSSELFYGEDKGEKGLVSLFLGLRVLLEPTKDTISTLTP
jgi:hypothetical protein